MTQYKSLPFKKRLKFKPRTIPLYKNMLINILVLCKDIDYIDETYQETIDGIDIQTDTMIISVNVSDRFYLASSDWITIVSDDLPFLHSLVLKNPKWGALQWAIFKRKMLPHPRVEEWMRADNAWLSKFEKFRK